VRICLVCVTRLVYRALPFTFGQMQGMFEVGLWGGVCGPHETEIVEKMKSTVSEPTLTWLTPKEIYMFLNIIIIMSYDSINTSENKYLLG